MRHVSYSFKSLLPVFRFLDKETKYNGALLLPMTFVLILIFTMARAAVRRCFQTQDSMGAG